MLGSIAGDIIGSRFERHSIKRTEFTLFTFPCRFTDDTVLTLAVAEAIMTDGDYAGALRRFANHYPDAGYGGGFKKWMADPDAAPYRSFGNGSAMRVAPVGFAFDDEALVLAEAKRSAECTHNHPEGIKGAQAVALAILLARQGADKETIRREISGRFAYDLTRSIRGIRPGYRFDVSCQGSVPESIIAFLESTSVEHAIRLAVSLGGDADTQACIAGGIAHAFYGNLDATMVFSSCVRLSKHLADVVSRFEQRYHTIDPPKDVPMPWKPYELPFNTGDAVQMKTEEELIGIHEYFMQYPNAFAEDWYPLEVSVRRMQGIPLHVGMVVMYHGGIPLAYLSFMDEGKPITIRVMQMVLKGRA